VVAARIRACLLDGCFGCVLSVVQARVCSTWSGSASWVDFPSPNARELVSAVTCLKRWVTGLGKEGGREEEYSRKR
jgi:hypothetical protein